MRCKKTILFLLLFIPVCSLFAGITGKVAGRVIDGKTGEPLFGATIQLKNTTLGATSDAKGYYFIINVPPGTYAVTASYIGYKKVTKVDIAVYVDRTSLVDFVLEEETIQGSEVIVQGRRIDFQKDQTSTIQNMSNEEISLLPVNNVTQVLSLQTGVVNTGSLHIRGGRAGEVAYFLDGYRMEDPLFNDNVLEVSNQSIQQMEFLSGTFNAEYGNALSGVVNIVTKENFDVLRANVTYKRTKNGLETASNDLNERYWEANINGPFWKGSPIGFLLSFKKVDADNYYYSGLSRITKDSLGKTFYETIEFSKDKPYGYDDYLTLMGKLFIKPFSTAKISLLYNFSDRNWQNYNHLLRFIPDSGYVFSSGSNLIGANFLHTLSERYFYELRVSYFNYKYKRNLKGLDYTQYTIPLYLRFDNSRFYRSYANSAFEDQKTKTLTLKGDFTGQIDRVNLLKAGFEIKSHDLDYFYIENPASPNGRFGFNYRNKPIEASVYVQDKIEFETIILNLGMRFDLYNGKASYFEDPFNKTTTKEAEYKTSLSPRIGIAYPVTKDIIFHFSYGQFFQRPEFQVMYNNLDRLFGNDEPLFGNPNLKPEKTASYELGIFASLFGDINTSQLTFFSKKIENLIGVSWIYQPQPYAYYVNEDFATVKGFEISSKWRYKNLSLNINYTYSVAEGSSSSQQERYSGVFDIVGLQSLRFLPLDFDQRHTANAQLIFNFNRDEGPFGFLPIVFQNSSISLISKYGSGLPYTFNPTRAIYVAETNNSRMPYTLFFDLYVRKDFYIDKYYISIFADIRNLLNRKNIRTVYSTTGSPDFSGSELKNATPDYDQNPTNYYPPRTIYLGINLGF